MKIALISFDNWGLNEGIAITTKINTGIAVHKISTNVLCTVLEGFLFLLAEYL